jgi:hypothetical protein
MEWTYLDFPDPEGYDSSEGTMFGKALVSAIDRSRFNNYVKHAFGNSWKKRGNYCLNKFKKDCAKVGWDKMDELDALWVETPFHGRVPSWRICDNIENYLKKHYGLFVDLYKLSVGHMFSEFSL